MSNKEEQLLIQENAPERGLVRRYLTGTTSLVGSVTSVVNTVKVGADAITGGVDAVAGAVQRTAGSTRVESFAQALARLGVAERDLPRIHNQILVQLYGTFIVALLSFVAAVFYVSVGKRGVLVPLICVGLFLGSLSMWVQSSVQAYQIRERKLGLTREWFGSTKEWFPARLGYEIAIPIGDSRLDPKMGEQLARYSRRHYAVAGVFVVAATAALIATPKGAIPGAALLAFVVAALSAGRGVSLSCLVLQAREGRECDLLYWLSRPYRWIP